MRSLSSTLSSADLSPDYRRQREAFPQLHDRGIVLRSTLSAREDRIDRVVAEGEQVWMRYYVCGTHQADLCGLAASGKRVGVPVVEISRFADGRLKESWRFGDELGMLLQLGAPNLLQEQQRQ